jgi:hypothetical protein
MAEVFSEKHFAPFLPARCITVDVDSLGSLAPITSANPSNLI